MRKNWYITDSHTGGIIVGSYQAIEIQNLDGAKLDTTLKTYRLWVHRKKMAEHAQQAAYSVRRRKFHKRRRMYRTKLGQK